MTVFQGCEIFLAFSLPNQVTNISLTYYVFFYKSTSYLDLYDENKIKSVFSFQYMHFKMIQIIHMKILPYVVNPLKYME